MNIIEKILKNIWIIRTFWSTISILVSIILYNIFIKSLSSKIETKKILSSKKSQTYMKLIKSITRYILIGITILVILQIFGINITSMVAGVGIISIIIGFAIQDALKDIIKGMDIISDNYYQVGDVIKIGNTSGKVLAIGLKTTKIQDIYSMNIISISNRNIEQVEIVSNLINLDIPLPYETKIEKAEKAMEEAVEKLKKQKEIENAEYRGINDLADSSIKYQIKVYCDPTKKVQIRRDALKEILLTLKEHNISIPYNQLDIHTK